MLQTHPRLSVFDSPTDPLPEDPGSRSGVSDASSFGMPIPKLFVSKSGSMQSQGLGTPAVIPLGSAKHRQLSRKPESPLEIFKKKNSVHSVSVGVQTVQSADEGKTEVAEADASEAEKRLREYLAARKHSFTTETDAKIIKLLTNSHKLLSCCAFESQAAYATLLTPVSSISELTAEVITPVMDLLKKNEGDNGSTSYTFFDVFFLHFHKHSEILRESSGGHLGLLTELLQQNDRQQAALCDLEEKFERATAQSEGLTQYNDLLLKQAMAGDRTFCDNLLTNMNEGPRFKDIASLTDPIPPDETLTQQIKDLTVKNAMLNTTSKLHKTQLLKDIWDRDEALTRAELLCEQLKEREAAAKSDLQDMINRDRETTGTQTTNATGGDPFGQMVAFISDNLTDDGMESTADFSPSGFSSAVTSRRQTEEDLKAQIGRHIPLEIAPSGMCALVFTDIQSSTFLWNLSPVGMRQAIKDHNILMRRAIKRFNGYEVKTEGDAFMVSFQDTLDACRWCVEVQVECLHTEWPEDICGVEDTTDIKYDDDGNVVFSGIRVRMGIHLGEAMAEEDPTTLRMDYFGPEVNFAARVSSKGRGGEVVLSGTAYEELKPYFDEDPFKYIGVGGHLYELGYFHLKGYDEDVLLHHVFAEELKTRRNHFKKDDPPAVEEPPVGNTTPAPAGEVTLVFTTIHNSRKLWEAAQGGMMAGLELHNHLIRSTLAECDGYEVHAEGGAFAAAFGSPLAAARWAMQVQTALLALEWPEELLAVRECKPINNSAGTSLLWRGLRLRMGIHTGWPLCQESPGGKVDYLGPVSIKGMRILEHCHGGEVLVSRELDERLRVEIEECDDPFLNEISTKTLENLGGFEGEKVFSLLPKALSERTKKAQRAEIVGETVLEMKQLNEDQERELAELDHKLQKAELEAPKGEIAILHTAACIPGLWNVAPAVASQSVDILVEIYRSLLEKNAGYVIRSDGDFIAIAFQTIEAAVKFAASLQTLCLTAEWPDALLSFTDIAVKIVEDGTTLFSGLQTRTSITVGTPNLKKDPLTLRYNYTGEPVEVGMQVLNVCKPGQTLCPFLKVTPEMALEVDYELCDVGESVKSGEQFAQILPFQLKGRKSHFARMVVAPPAETIIEPVGANVRGPSGVVTAVFVDIEDSPFLWQNHASIMQVCSGLKNRLFAESSKRFKAYHVSSEGDAAMFVFGKPELALNWCLTVQLGLLELDYPPEVDGIPGIAKVKEPRGDVVLFRGLRMRMSIAKGPCLTEVDEKGKTHYRGTFMKTAVTLLDFARGGQILCEPAMYKDLAASDFLVAASLPADMTPGETVHWHEKHCVTQIHQTNEGEACTSIVPHILRNRYKEGGGEKREPPVHPLTSELNVALRNRVERCMFTVEVSEKEEQMLSLIEEKVKGMSQKKDEVVYMLTVDIDDSYALWEAEPVKMRTVVATLHRMIATLCSKQNGELTRVNGDAVLILFTSADDCLATAALLQTTALTTKWPLGIGDEFSHVANHWCGPRIRCGVHSGKPQKEKSGVLSTSYACGQEILRSSELCGRASGGEILCEKKVWEAVQSNCLKFHEFSGDDVSLTPTSLKARTKGYVKPAFGDEKFAVFVPRPVAVPVNDVLTAVIQVPTTSAAYTMSSVRNAKGGLIIEDEGTCIVMVFGSGKQLLQWAKELATIVRRSRAPAPTGIQHRIGVQTSGKLRPARGSEGESLNPDKKAKAAKLCEYAHMGEILVTSDVLKKLAVRDLEREGFRSSSDGYHSIFIPSVAFEVEKMPRSVSRIHFPWHSKTEGLKKPVNEKVKQLYLRSHEQRLNILGCTVALLADIDLEIMSSHDDYINGKDRSAQSGPAVHQLSMHYRTVSFLLDRPESMRYLSMMKERAQRLSMPLCFNQNLSDSHVLCISSQLFILSRSVGLVRVCALLNSTGLPNTHTPQTTPSANALFLRRLQMRRSVRSGRQHAFG